MAFEFLADFELDRTVREAVVAVYHQPHWDNLCIVVLNTVVRNGPFVRTAPVLTADAVW